MKSGRTSSNNRPGKKLISRREMLKLSAASAAGLALAACTKAPANQPAGQQNAPATNAPASSGAKANIRLLTWYGEQKDEFPKIISEYEAKNPNVKIELQLKTDVTGAYLPALLASAAANDLPEIYAPHVHSVEFGKKGLGADLAKDLGQDFMKDFFPSQISMFQDGAAIYAVGWMAQTMGIFYDSDAFSKAGISGEPETWDDMIKASNQIKEKIPGNLGVLMIGSDGYSVSDTWLPMITGATDDPETLKKLDFHQLPWTDQSVVDSLTLYRKTLDEGLWQKGLTGMKDADCNNALYQGKAAAFYTGSWIPTTFYQEAPPDLMKRIKVMKTPAYKAGGRHWTGNSAGAAFAIANNSKFKQQAIDFFKYMYSPEVYARTMNNSKSMPSTQGAMSQVTDPFMKTMGSWLPDGCRHWLVGPAAQVISDAIMDFTAGKVKDPKQCAQIMEEGAAKLKYD